MSLRDRRRAFASEIDALDSRLNAIQAEKKDAVAAYREANGKAETKATQAAIRRRQKHAAGLREALETHDALTDEAFIDISPGTISALTRAPRHEAA